MKLTHCVFAMTVTLLAVPAWAEDMPGMKMDGMSGASASPTQVASAEGTIKTIDHDKHTVTISHGAVQALQWPPMTMGFAVSDQQIAGLEAGDKVSFSFSLSGGRATIVSIRK